MGIINILNGLDALHSKILKSNFANDVLENEMMALAECKIELKKRIPKKPEKKPDRYCDLIHNYYCPSCGRYFGQRGVHNAILFNKERYCQGENCGQAIDWNGEE